MRYYKNLKNQVFSYENFKIVPIRDIDKEDIMVWRNEQIYHLRQKNVLTIDAQKKYFDTKISKLFDLEKPDQILFSFLKNNKCIGYGGLVHINWFDLNAEISFLMNTKLEKNFFSFHWKAFLNLLEIVAFNELNLHKIYTYAFDLRPKLYTTVESLGYVKEAELKEHFKNKNRFESVIIHSKINPNK